MAEKQNILIVDNEVTPHEYLLHLLLIDYGADVDFATDNIEALEFVKSKKYDAILYDVGLDRGKTGHDFPVARKLRELARESTIFIAISLGSGPGYQGLRENFDGWIDTFARGEKKIEEMKRLGVPLEEKVR